MDMDNKKKAKVLSTITREQWKAIASLTQEQWQKLLESDERSSENNKFEEHNQAEFSVRSIMKELGITPNLKGYNYLLEAVMCVYNDPSYMDSVTKRLYPDIAIKFHTTPSRVERAIRHVITKSFDNGDLDVINKYLSYSYIKGSATNSEAIAQIAEYVKTH